MGTASDDSVQVVKADTTPALMIAQTDSNIDKDDIPRLIEVHEKTVLRKIDRRIVPLMFVCYCLQYLDKTLVNYANVMGLQPDTHMTGNQFSYLALVFYVSYLAFEMPTGYLMQRLPTAKYLGVNVALWGVMVACTSAAKNFAGLVTLRVLLGVFESVVAPALILISGMWYKRSEQPLRIGFWYCGTGIGTMIGAVCSFGFQHYTGHAFSSWQIMFLVFGLITVSIGILIFFILPDNPMTSTFLTVSEKMCAIERLRVNQSSIENKTFKTSQFWECLRDPQTWLLSILTVAFTIPNGAISSYQATIIQGFGYTPKQTTLLSIPSGAVSLVSIIGATWSASKFNMRSPWIIILLCCGIIGSALMAFDKSKAGRLIGNYMTNCIGAALPLVYSWVAANFAGHTKKVTMNAILLMSFCLGNILGPLTFEKKAAPEYIPAKITILATTSFSVLLTLILVGYYQWENKRRTASELMTSNGPATSDSPPFDIDFADVTDRENRHFKYCL